jgi:hypothetical protein
MDRGGGWATTSSKAVSSQDLGGRWATTFENEVPTFELMDG